MSVSPKDELLDRLQAILIQLPFELLALLVQWLDGADKDPDPVGYLLRRAQADTAHKASQAALAAALAAVAKKD